MYVLTIMTLFLVIIITIVISLQNRMLNNEGEINKIYNEYSQEGDALDEIYNDNIKKQQE